jgi:hypothetical protein
MGGKWEFSAGNARFYRVAYPEKERGNKSNSIFFLRFPAAARR